MSQVHMVVSEGGTPRVLTDEDSLVLGEPLLASLAEKAAFDIVYKQGAQSSGATVGTWAEVEALLAAWTGPVTIWIDSSLTEGEGSARIPAGSMTDFAGRVTLRAVSSSSKLRIDEGAYIQNVTDIVGLHVLLESSVLPPIRQDQPGLILGLRDRTLLDVQGGMGTYIIEVTNNAASFSEIAASGDGSVYSAVSTALISLPPSSTFVVAGQGYSSGAGIEGASWLPANALDSPVSCTIAVFFDASSRIVAQTFVLGDFFQSPYDLSQNVHPHSGSTVDRPVDNLFTGQQFYDSDLHQPIWWSGSVWKDAMGTDV